MVHAKFAKKFAKPAKVYSNGESLRSLRKIIPAWLCGLCEKQQRETENEK